MGLNRKGVCYDVGRVMLEGDWCPHFDPNVVHRELGIIKNDLHCNSVRICGRDVERLRSAALDALEQGMEVWFSPEFFDGSPDETLGYLRRAAAVAEELRKRSQDRVILSIGSELTLFMKGIAEGKHFFERMNNPSFWDNVRTGKYNEPLNNFLKNATEFVREVFHGKVTYFSVPFERINWDIFDFLGVDLYRDSTNQDYYDRTLKSLVSSGKPVIIGEFGCCSYKGAEKLGGSGFMIIFGMMGDSVKQKLPPLISRMIKIPPQIDGHYIRDEGVQAREIKAQLGILESAGVEGAFAYTFVAPTSPHVEDPRYDGDMASYSLVKSYSQPESADQIVTQTVKIGKEILGVDLDPNALSKFKGEVGKHGTTYPDMTWEPKEAFGALAEFYQEH